MDSVRNNYGVKGQSRSSSFLSQGSGSISRPRETSSGSGPKAENPFKRQLSGGSSKWTGAFQAAAASMSGRSNEQVPAQETSTKPGLLAWLEDNSNRTRKDTLYFGKDISTSMWWRFRRGGESNSQRAVDAADEAGQLRYENSYRMQPKPGCHFRPEKVEAIMNEVLESELSHKRYVPENGPELVKRLSEEIKHKVKLLCFERYRLVVFIQVGQIEGADTMVISRCVWNTETDCYATATFQNGWVYAIATTYGIYLD
ncbi:tctex1 domain-containing protein 1-like [Acanthaster planci]|uniref:Tctex1 domain-containing protein 1-like n=1 Tax=Acanthaster planci TaxID=133434 RepID=A0A8B7Z7M0_ACAPL|nr:tctex1 domain-containing protein 1-like [Acanthaster planci]